MEEVIMENNVRCEMSQSESLIMDFLWKNDGGKGFSEIMEYLNGELHKNWKKQTINTFIRHLIDKGLISADTSQKSRRYSAALTPAEYARGKADKILADFYDGSVEVFLSALTGGKKLSRELVDELDKMMKD
jgi:predicted transcriptional regulator